MAEEIDTGDGRTHRGIVAGLLVVGTLVAFLAIFSIWVNRQALNTDNWVDTSTRLIQNEKVRSQLSDYLADQLFANVDVILQIRPPTKEQLAPLEAALTSEERDVLLHHGTEAPFCGGLLGQKDDGVYCCRLCALPLFDIGA